MKKIRDIENDKADFGWFNLKKFYNTIDNHE